MANSAGTLASRDHLAPVSRAVAAYVVIVVGTVIALGVLASTAPELATDEAWGHALIVTVFAVLLPVRLRSARRGNRRALTAVAVVAAVLSVVNAVESALPVFPTWMRWEMVVVAALMSSVGALAARARRR